MKTNVLALTSQPDEFQALTPKVFDETESEILRFLRTKTKTYFYIMTSCKFYQAKTEKP